MSPFMKGALGFLGCAVVCKVVYEIGKRKGKQEVIDENKVALDPEPGPKKTPTPGPINDMSYFVFAIAAIATLSVGGGAIWLIKMKK